MSDRPINIRKRGDNRSFRRDDAPLKKGSFASAIGWSVFLLLLVALAGICWLGTYYVFGHPEEPTSYALLQKLKKIDQPRRFVDTAAPRGEFLSGTQLLERYEGMGDAELRRESAAMLRDFLWNYKDTSRRTAYIIGRFNILDSYELTSDDFFTSGIVAVAQDTDNPRVLMEHIFSAEPRMVPMLHRSLLTGLDIPIKRTYDLSAVINVRRLADGRMVFSAIPIHYPSYTATSGPGGFALEPPTVMNVAAGLPIIGDEKIAEADQHYAQYRRRMGLTSTDPLLAANRLPGSPPAAAQPAADELVRVQPAVSMSGEEATPVDPEAVPGGEPVVLSPSTSPEPDPRVAVAVPVTVDPQMPPEAVAPAVADATPPAPEPTPTPAPTPTPTPEVELKPFVQPTPAPAAAVASTSGGRWQTYSPGQMPRGRLVSVRETQQLADGGTSGERVYLQGNFVVTASGQNRAVLRSQAGGPLGMGGASNTRIIVEFPSGGRTPGEGANVSRSSDRPFLITDVKRTADGQVNVFVREITTD